MTLPARAHSETFPPVSLSAKESAKLYQQARITPGARQIGLSCAFFANVPLVTMTSGINIADGSAASKEVISSIYGLRKGDFKFSSAFDRDMFFQIFSITAKGESFYYREAPRVDLLVDSKEIITKELAKALDQGMFVSLRVKGTYGTPHNVLLLAYRKDTYYFHDPIIGRIVNLSIDDLASKMISVSKERSKETRRYFSSYHLVALPAPNRLNQNFLTIDNLAKKQELKLSLLQQTNFSQRLKKVEGVDGVMKSFPEVSFAVSRKDGKSLISKELEPESMKGVFNLTKLAIGSYGLGLRDVLPVWLLDGAPLVAMGYSEGENTMVVFSDGTNRTVMDCDEALKKFKQSGCFYGYIRVLKP